MTAVSEAMVKETIESVKTSIKNLEKTGAEAVLLRSQGPPTIQVIKDGKRRKTEEKNTKKRVGREVAHLEEVQIARNLERAQVKGMNYCRKRAES